MAVHLAAEEKSYVVGKPTQVFGKSPKNSLGVVFEDDGETGYLYAFDTASGEMAILDSMHIFNVDQVSDGKKPSNLSLVWSADGLKAALLINKYPHAVFDFESKRGYCRTGFPPADRNWTKFDHTWVDASIDLFK